MRFMMIGITELLCSLFCVLSVQAVIPTSRKHTIRRTYYNSNKYYVPPSETPNFTTLADYSGQNIDRQWAIRGGNIRVDQEVTNAIQLTWRKDDTAVTLHRYVTNAVDQQWQFGGAKIILKHYVTGAIYQMWNLGNKWYHYERSVTGRVRSEGTATGEDLDRYKDQIDLWCQANRRFFHPQYCPIY